MRFAEWKKFPLTVLIALTFAGCATQKINWQARVGIYTYDQALQEYGPPDKSAKLADGATMADWLIREGHIVVTPQPYLVPPGGFGPAPFAYNQTYIPSYYMRLVFSADGKLKEYKNFSR